MASLPACIGLLSDTGGFLQGLMEKLRDPWSAVGFFGQILFFSRFLVQWVVSEKRKKSVVPISFWWLSITGAAVTLTYALHRQDPVFIMGYSIGFFVYFRNLVLIWRERRATPA